MKQGGLVDRVLSVMPDRHRLLETSAGAILIAILLLLLAASQNQHATAQATNALRNMAYSNEQVPLEPTPNPNPERNEWRQEQDLKAQLEMARWAFWMVVLGLIGIVLNFFGIFLIYRTLRETQRMAVEAEKATQTSVEAVRVTREVGERQTRAYLGLKEVRLTLNSAEGMYRGHFIVKNHGATPARDVYIAPEAVFYADPVRVHLRDRVELPDQHHVLEATLLYPDEERVVPVIRPWNEVLTLPDDDIASGRNLIVEGEIEAAYPLFIEGAILYRTFDQSDEDPPRVTRFLFELTEPLHIGNGSMRQSRTGNEVT